MIYVLEEKQHDKLSTMNAHCLGFNPHESSLKYFGQVFKSSANVLICLKSDLEGPQRPSFSIMERTLALPSSFMERTPIILSSYMEKTFPLNLCIACIPRNLLTILTVLLSIDIVCLVPAKLEVKESSSKSQCQSTRTIYHLPELLVVVVSAPPFPRMWLSALLLTFSRTYGSSAELF